MTRLSFGCLSTALVFGAQTTARVSTTADTIAGKSVHSIALISDKKHNAISFVSTPTLNLIPIWIAIISAKVLPSPPPTSRPPITAMAKSIFTELLSVSYPSLPFFEFIPEGVNIGSVILIEGFVPQNCSQFTIDLIDGQTVDEKTSKQADIPLGMTFLIDDSVFVGNTRRDGEWGRPQKDRIANIKGKTGAHLSSQSLLKTLPII